MAAAKAWKVNAEIAKRQPKYSVMFHPEIAVMSMELNKQLDVVVRFKVGKRNGTSIVRCDANTGERYFMAARLRVYYSDLREIM